MSTPIEPQDEPKRNTLATASLVLGALSVAFAQFCTVPGNISAVGCLGGILAIAAVVTGVLGIRAAQQGQGKRPAIGGIFTAAIGLAVFLFVFIPAMARPGGVWTHLQATPTPTITPTPTLTPTPTVTPTVTPQPTSTPAPQTHYGNSFAITFTDEWKKLDIEEQCQGPQSECLALYNRRTDIQLHIYRETLQEIVDLERMTESILASFESKSLLGEREEVEVGGQRGLSQTFASQYSGRTEYVRLIVVMDEYDRYIFFVVAPSEDRLERHRDEVMAIILSVQFTTEGAPDPTAAPEIAPPTSVLPTAVPPTGYAAFTGDRFTLTYPEDWQEDEDFSRADICQEPGVFCLALVHPTEEGIGLQLIRYTFERPSTTEEADQVIWAQLVAPAYDSVNLDSFEKIEIDGQPAIKRIFYGTLGDIQEYVLYVIVADENDVYHFQGRTPSAEAFEQYQPTIEEIIFSLRFLE